MSVSPKVSLNFHTINVEYNVYTKTASNEAKVDSRDMVKIIHIRVISKASDGTDKFIIWNYTHPLSIAGIST